MSLDLYEHRLERGEEGAPALLLLHGTGGDEASFLDLGRAMAPGWTLLSLRGNVDERGMARFFRRLGEGVYDMDDLARRTGELASFLDAASETYALRRDETFALGYSNGANILANLLFVQPDAVACAALMHPLIPFEPAPQPRLEGKPILVTAGEHDPICPPGETRRLAEWLGWQGAALDLRWQPGGHEATREELVGVSRWLRARAPAEADGPAA